MPRALRRKDVRIDLSPLNRFQRGLSRGMDGAAPGNPIHDFWTQAGGRYLEFAQRRYLRFSRGGGDWPPLAPATKRSRRRKRKRKGHRGPRKFAILIDESMLFDALAQGSPGNVMRRSKGGITVGIGGGPPHPNAGQLTIGRLAEIHNEGLGNVPQREIVPEELDQATAAGIRNDLKRAIGRLGKQSER